MPMREISPFSIENLLSHSTEKLRRGTLPSVFHKVSGIEKIYGSEGEGGKREGVSRYSVKNFLSYSAEKIRRGTLLCCVSEIFR